MLHLEGLSHFCYRSGTATITYARESKNMGGFPTHLSEKNVGTPKKQGNYTHVEVTFS